MAEPAEELSATYADYLREDDGQRMEIIYGEVFALAAPGRKHQYISRELTLRLGNFLEDKPCELYTAPFDVRLFEQPGDAPEDVDTVVQPDLLVVCDLAKLDDRGCIGAPDLTIEILSPSSQRRDFLLKWPAYERAGVREYWIVDPETETVRVMRRDDHGLLQPERVYGRSDTVPVGILPGCTVDLRTVFPA